MTTRADMIDEMASLTKRDDLTTEIGQAISYAIKTFQDEKLYINEKVDVSFTCVIDQQSYDVDDDADIPKIADIETMILIDGTQRYNPVEMSIAEMQLLLDGNVASNRPSNFAFFGKSIFLYPPPDAAYVINVIGPFAADEPASDVEADNVWMNEAYHAVLHRALGWLYRFHIRDYEQADKNDAESYARLEQLYTRTNRRKSNNKLIPTQW